MTAPDYLPRLTKATSLPSCSSLPRAMSTSPSFRVMEERVEVVVGLTRVRPSGPLMPTTMAPVCWPIPASRRFLSTNGDPAGRAERIPVEDDSPTPTATRADDGLGRYGYSTDYRRLRGRLEFLESQKQWKLRYIPIDGKTDKYGGSVVIAPPDALAGCERGDFLELEGQLSERDSDSGDFAPAYEVTKVRSLPF